jgi:nucleotidyltransferase AbiEii toxin of type IV toxin-antitoxin system
MPPAARWRGADEGWLAKERNQPFELLLTRYVLERFLYRLGESKHRDRFVLKGAILMTTWLGDPHRPTRDLVQQFREFDRMAVLRIEPPAADP